MRISAELHDEMVAHALADAPDECCGIVSSRDGEAVELFRMENTAHTWMRYEMDNMELYRVLTGIGTTVWTSGSSTTRTRAASRIPRRPTSTSPSIPTLST
jgi:proteasome lid subunit RPN8/RPN11